MLWICYRARTRAGLILFYFLHAFLAFSGNWLVFSAARHDICHTTPNQSQALKKYFTIFGKSQWIGGGGEVWTYCVLRCVWVIFYASTTRTKGNHKAARELSVPVNSVCHSARSTAPLLPCHLPSPLYCAVIVRGLWTRLGWPIKRPLWLNSAYARRVKNSTRKSIILCRTRLLERAQTKSEKGKTFARLRVSH